MLIISPLYNSTALPRQNRGEDFVEIVRLNKGLVDHCRGRQRPVAAGGVKALPCQPCRAKLDQVFQRLREEDDRRLRNKRNPGLVALARPWRELGLRDAHKRDSPVATRIS